MLEYKTLPDKWIRKAIYDVINGTTVNGVDIKLYDTRIPVDEAPDAYILMSDQTATPVKDNKCEYNYNCTFRLEVICQYPRAGNAGSRVLLNDICDLVRSSFNTLFTLEAPEGLTVQWQDISFGTDINNIAGSYLIYRKAIIASFYVS